MSEQPRNPFNLNLTDEEFVALHAEASAKGIQVNDFIVATLRQHMQTALDIQAVQREEAAQSGDSSAVPSPS